MKKKIIILDFATTETHVFDYDEGTFEDFYDFIEAVNEEFDLHLSESNCEWMIVKELNIQIH